MCLQYILFRILFNKLLFLTLSQTPCNLNFPHILFFQKIHSLLKLTFKATYLGQRPKFDIFQKALFFTLALFTNFVLEVVPIAAGKYL